MNNNSDRSLADYIKNSLELIVLAIELILSVLAFLQVLRDNFSIVTILFFAVAIVLSQVWLWCIILKKQTSIISTLAHGSQSNVARIPAYSRKSRRLALLGSIAVIAIALLSGAVGLYIRYAPTDKVIVLVARFEGPDMQNYRVTETILEQLRDATRKYPEVTIKPLAKSINVEDGEHLARDLGDQHKASIVLWGWYASTKEKAVITAHFELLNKPENLDIKDKKRTFNTPIAELDSFRVQTQLSGEINSLVLLTVGLIRYELNDYDGAISRFTEALNQPQLTSQFWGSDILYFYRGLTYIKLENFDAAIADYNQVISLTPSDKIAYINRGNAHLGKRNLDLALADYNSAIQIDNEYALAYYSRGSAHVQKGNIDLATADLDRAISLDPTDADAYNVRAIAYDIKGLYELAIKDFSVSIEKEPNYFGTYSNRGKAYLHMSAYDVAIADFEKALSINPNSVSTLYDLGVSYYQMGKHDLAMQVFLKIINDDPNFAEAYYGLGTLNVHKQDYDAALENFSKAINLKADYDEAYNNRGAVYYLIKSLDKALLDFNRAIMINPRYAEAYTNRGNVYDEKGEYKHAMDDYDKALVFKPDYVQAHYDRAIAYLRRGEKNKALVSLKKALELTRDPSMKEQIQQLLISNYGY